MQMATPEELQEIKEMIHPDIILDKPEQFCLLLAEIPQASTCHSFFHVHPPSQCMFFHFPAAEESAQMLGVHSLPEREAAGYRSPCDIGSARLKSMASCLHLWC
jgi:hypothetical protein